MHNRPSLPFERLAEVAAQTPVVVSMDPLAALGLPANTRLFSDETSVLAELDDPEFDASAPMVILSQREDLQTRFPAYQIVGRPSAQLLNQVLPNRLALARSLLLRNHEVARHIIEDVRKWHPPVVVLLLIDGLSYEDACQWGWSTQPCLVDGPSVTFRFDKLNPEKVNRNIGFAALVGTPSVASQLRSQGFKHFRGFSYWQRGQNTVSDALFQHIPLSRVQGFSTVLETVRANPIQPGTYLQIVREGLDGLAHGKRELSRWEVEGALQAIHNDISALLAILRQNFPGALVYVTADHGILWKHEHTFERLLLENSRPRYTEGIIPNYLQAYITELQGYGALHYPYLGASINTNDAGVHGGLSYHESIVPFIRIEA
jgi:hypothetical protein